MKVQAQKYLILIFLHGAAYGKNKTARLVLHACTANLGLVSDFKLNCWIGQQNYKKNLFTELKKNCP